MRKTFLPGTATSQQVLGEKLMRTPVKDIKAHRNGRGGTRVVNALDEDGVTPRLCVAAKVHRGLPAVVARDMRYQERRYVSGKRMASPTWQAFFDKIPEMKHQRDLAIARLEHADAKDKLDEAAADAVKVTPEQVAALLAASGVLIAAKR